MEVSFEDDALRELCTSERLATRKLGSNSARKLKARLADLKAVGSVLKLPAGKPHALNGNRAGQYAVSLAGGCRLVLAPNHKPIPRTQDGGTDWAAVNMVKIIEIGDYHD